MFDNIRSALQSIWSNKIRSVLTVLGVILGVWSVTTLVAIGQGLQKDVATLVQGLGSNVIAVVSGKIDTSSGSMNSANPADFLAGDILTLDDVAAVTKTEHVTTVSPIALVSGSLRYGDKTASPTLFASYPNLLDTLELLKVQEGSMFTSTTEKSIVLSKPARDALFPNESPIGKKVQLGKEELTVVGALGPAEVKNALSNEYENVSIIPFDEATVLNKNQVKIYRILMKADAPENVAGVKSSIGTTLTALHEGQENFTVLTQEDILGLFDDILGLSTAMVSAIAAISLIVGGIGIMNIMLVTVTERTREIGLRKAVGATRSAILLQFLTEAIIITLLGGIIGLALSFAAGQLVEAKSPLTPVFSWEVVALAVGISTGIGIVFGLWPALRAARKDPIEALRYE